MVLKARKVLKEPKEWEARPPIQVHREPQDMQGLQYGPVPKVLKVSKE